MSLFRRTCFQAHWMVGISAGLLLALIGLTGALLAVERPVIEWLNADVRTVQPSGERLSIPTILERIQAGAVEDRVASVDLLGDPASAVRVTLNSDENEIVRYLDPYSAQWQIEYGTRGETFFDAVMGLHRWLMLGDRAIGRQIVGICTLLLILLALTGLYLRWPRRAANWRNWLLVKGRLRGRGFLWSLHAVIGTYMLVIYLFLAGTGLYWSYEWYRGILFRLAAVEQPLSRPVTAQDTAPSVVDIEKAWESFLRENAATGFSTVSIRFPSEVGQPLSIRYLDPKPSHNRAFNSFVVDTSTGNVVEHDRYVDRTLGGKVMSSMFALHTGSFFGSVGTALFMLASLGMPIFTVTGWMMYLGRRRARKRAQRPLRGSAAIGGVSHGSEGANR